MFEVLFFDVPLSVRTRSRNIPLRCQICSGGLQRGPCGGQFLLGLRLSEIDLLRLIWAWSSSEDQRRFPSSGVSSDSSVPLFRRRSRAFLRSSSLRCASPCSASAVLIFPVISARSFSSAPALPWPLCRRSAVVRAALWQPLSGFPSGSGDASELQHFFELRPMLFASRGQGRLISRFSVNSRAAFAQGTPPQPTWASCCALFSKSRCPLGAPPWLLRSSVSGPGGDNRSHNATGFQFLPVVCLFGHGRSWFSVSFTCWSFPKSYFVLDRSGGSTLVDLQLCFLLPFGCE